MKCLKQLILALIFSIWVKATDGEFSSNLVSIQEKRLLNTCKTFEYDSVSDTWYVDGNTSGQTLQEACHKDTGLDCCNSGGEVNDNVECTYWNKLLPYTICSGSCQGTGACRNIAWRASGGSVTIHSNACTSTYACYSIGSTIQGHDLYVEVGSGSCGGFSTICQHIGSQAMSLTRIIVPPNECLQENQCTICGGGSTFEGTFVATDACCAADGVFWEFAEDVACNGSQAPSKSPTPSNLPSSIPSNVPSSIPSDLPSDIPSDIHSDQPSSVPSLIPSDIPSDSPSDQPSSLSSSNPSKSPSLPPVEPPSPCANQRCNDAGKCEVTSTTDFKCVCETTFINSANGHSCECPTGFIRKSDNRCYDLTTPSPISLTKTPTASPVIKTLESSSPSKAPTDEIEGCKDDENAKFYLINKPSKNVKCSWLTKNTARTGKRIANYCGLNRVKNICKSTCSFCTCVDDDSFSFEMINLEKRETCDWLTRNDKKSEIRIERYCTEKFDDGSVMNACTKSCGLCK